MATIHGFSFGAFVVEAVFLNGKAAFVLGDGTVRITDGDEQRAVTVHNGAVLCAAVTRDGRLLTGGDDGLVATTDSAGTVTRVAERPKKWIDNVAAGPGGAVAFSVSKQAIVHFADGRERTFDQETPVGGLAFSPKGLRLAVVGNDGVTLLWVGTNAASVKFARAGAHIGASFSPDGRYLMTALQDNTLHGWRIDNPQDFRMSGYVAKPKSLSWSAKGRYLATSGGNSAVLWPFLTKDGPVNKRALGPGARDVPVTRVACHPKDDVVAVGYRDGVVLVARYAEQLEAKLRQGGASPISALAYDDSGTRLAFGAEDGSAGMIELD